MREGQLMILKDNVNFSLWCDFIERDFLEKGFQTIINNKTIYGATSNPAIFEQAISGSEAYTQQINMLQANENKKIYEELAIADIKRAAELLQPLYENDSQDGYISIEVDPTLCDDAMGTIEEGTRLYKSIGYENVMIKVPATEAGYIAMENLTSMGINVNATLIFTAEQAIKCATALDNGIKSSQKEPYAVISVFVSRFDRELDGRLEELNITPSQTGIYNAAKCYHEIEKFGNKNIRTLFASTGVKGDNLDADYYVKSLVYPHSVNTAPLATIEAYVVNDRFMESDIISEADCDTYFESLKSNGIDINSVGNKLLNDGLEAFKVSFGQMLEKLKER
jgi:transaldolase